MKQYQEQHQEYVLIDDIEATLAKEWATLAQQVERKTGSPPLRNHVVTLVIVTSNNDDVRLAHELIHQLRPACPSRAIILQLGGETASSNARVWAHCELDKDVVNRSFDVLEITLDDDRVNAAPNIISRHKLTDVPIVLYWWGEVDFGSMICGRILRTADRLVYDSSCFDDALQAMCDIASFLDLSATGQIGTDLAWRRIAIWRQLVAQSFDVEPVSRLAATIRAIDLTYGFGYQAEALLLAGWLASSLDWRPDAADFNPGTAILQASTGQGERCQLTLTEKARPGSGLHRLHIGASPNSNLFNVVIQHDTGDRSTISIDAPSILNLKRTVQHTEPSHVRLIGEELIQIERDVVYEQALAVARTFAEFAR